MSATPRPSNTRRRQRRELDSSTIEPPSGVAVLRILASVVNTRESHTRWRRRVAMHQLVEPASRKLSSGMDYVEYRYTTECSDNGLIARQNRAAAARWLTARDQVSAGQSRPPMLVVRPLV